MTFVALLKPLPGSEKKRLGRRISWKPPEGIKIIGEYWLPNREIACVCILEAENAAHVMEAYYEWFDVFETVIAPALPGKDGIALAKKFERG